MSFFGMNRRVLKLSGVTALSLIMLAGAALLSFIILDYLYPFPVETLRRQEAQSVRDRNGNVLRYFLSPDNTWRFHSALEDISPALIEAVIQSEDRWFHYHPGVNPLAVIRAAYGNIVSGRTVSGASTIPMQIARMSDPKPRTVASKLSEAFRAVQLKRLFTDDELIEIYLNIAPYGGNIEGVRAASYFYFGKSPKFLSPDEVALLTLLPRSPVAYDPTRNPQAALRERDVLLRYLEKRGVFTPDEVGAALKRPVPHVRKAQPFSAPHFAEYVYYEVSGRSGVKTTLDPYIQRQAELVARKRIDALRRKGLQNLAIVVIENEGRKLRAMVGSSDYFDKEFSGQVNIATARRSPGSTLKPFLYAMALDKGIMVPDTYLLDIPTDFSGYVAENYDERYRGKITMKNALILSLNAPAVSVLSRAGIRDFHNLLLNGGLSTLDRPTMSYGLPLILGAGEVTLLDLTNLYATLAGGGLHGPLRIIEDTGVDYGGTRLFSPEASYLITEILTELRRPDMPSSTWALTEDIPEVAWKTGTSYGHRDAWSIGYSSRYTIGVWVGNTDGSGRKGISGAGDAAPVLFDLFRALEGDGSSLKAPPGLNLGTVEVCRDSHLLATPFCAERDTITYIKGVTRIPRDNFAKKIFVDSETGELLLGDCISERPHTERIITTNPPELVAWQRAQGMNIDSMPPLSPRCNNVIPERSPVIVSPDKNTPYRVLAGMPSEHQQVELAAGAGEDAGKLFWYQDGKLVRSGSPDMKIFIPLEPGIHELVVVDSSGRSDAVSYKVTRGDNRLAGR